MLNGIDLTGKRLLVLGGSRVNVDIVKAAQRMGVYVIVTSHSENDYAKKFANESALVSTADIDALIKLVKDKKIDGVFARTDFNINNAITLCEKLDLPFYCNREQWEVFTDKTRFKELCIKHGIPVIEEFNLRKDLIVDDYKQIEYPVIVKPAQSSASRGISVCNNEIELQKGIQKASTVSRNGEILIEKFLTSEHVSIYITVQNGFVSLSAIADKFMFNFNDGTSPKPVAHFFPSKRLGDYYEKLHAKITKLCDELDIQNARIGLLTIFVEDEFFVVEASCRLIATREFIVVSHENKINHLDMLINLSLTGKFDGWDVKKHDNPKFKEKYCVLTMLSKDGKVSEVIGLEKIEKIPEVIDVHVYYSIGDEIKAHGTLQQVFARIYIVGNGLADLISNIQIVQNSLVVLNDKNQNMLLGGLNIDELINHYSG